MEHIGSTEPIEVCGAIATLYYKKSVEEAIELAGMQNQKLVIIGESGQIVFNNSDIPDEDILARTGTLFERGPEPILYEMTLLPHYEMPFIPQKSDNQPWAKRNKHRKPF